MSPYVNHFCCSPFQSFFTLLPSLLFSLLSLLPSPFPLPKLLVSPTPPSHGVAVPVALVFTSPVVWCVGTSISAATVSMTEFECVNLWLSECCVSMCVKVLKWLRACVKTCLPVLGWPSVYVYHCLGVRLCVGFMSLSLRKSVLSQNVYKRPVWDIWRNWATKQKCVCQCVFVYKKKYRCSRY